MFGKFNSVPFDDRVNRKATIDSIRRGYLEDFIRKSNSSLVQEINSSSIENLLLAEEVANETDTELDIRNIGVLMFAEHPEKFIPGAQIELIKFNTEEAEASDDFIEKVFTGPIWKQVEDALDYIKTNVIEEKVVKISGQAAAERFLIIRIMRLRKLWEMLFFINHIEKLNLLRFVYMWIVYRFLTIRELQNGLVLINLRKAKLEEESIVIEESVNCLKKSICPKKKVMAFQRF